MKRDFKLSSVVLINLLAGFLTALLTYALTASQNLAEYASTGQLPQVSGTSWLSDILSAVVTTLAGLIIARGLLRNRMGSVGDYLNNMEIITPMNFFVCLILDFIIFAVPTLLFAWAGDRVSQYEMGLIQIDGATELSVMIFAGIFALWFWLATAYKYYVVADEPKGLGFFEYIKRTFVTGHKLIGKTIITYLKYYILPTLGLILLIFLGFRMITSGEGYDPVAGIALYFFLIFIIAIAYIIWLVFANTFVQGDLSRFYLERFGKKDQIIIEG